MQKLLSNLGTVISGQSIEEVSIQEPVVVPEVKAPPKEDDTTLFTKVSASASYKKDLFE